MIIKYLNEGAFGNYRNKISKEDRYSKLKQRTADTVIRNFVDNIRDYVYDNLERITNIYDNTFVRMYLHFVNDKDAIHFNVDINGNRITVGVPVSYRENYVSFVPFDNFNGNFSIFNFLDHVNNCITNTEEIKSAADSMFGEDNYTFETKLYLIENNAKHLKIHCEKENNCIEFFKQFINLSFNAKSVEFSGCYRLFNGDEDLSKIDEYSKFIKTQYVLFSAFPRTMKSLKGLENIYAPSEGIYEYNTSLKFEDDLDAKRLTETEIEVLARKFTWNWLPLSKELIIELYGSKEEFIEHFIYDYAVFEFDVDPPEDEFEKAKLYLKGLRRIGSIAFDYENGKVVSDVCTDNY